MLIGYYYDEVLVVVKASVVDGGCCMADDGTCGSRARAASIATGLDLTAHACQADCHIMSRPQSRTILFNKPYWVLPCFTDPEGRATLADYIDLPGVYAAGRLDYDSEGLMILTSDGGLAHRITDPAQKLQKVYFAQVERVPDEGALKQLRAGVVLGGRRTRPAEVRLLGSEPTFPARSVPIRFRKTVPTAWVEITLREGMNRQVRRMTAAVGHPTLRLVRVAIGPMVLGDLQPGQWRELTVQEVARIAQGAEFGRRRTRVVMRE